MWNIDLTRSGFVDLPHVAIKAYVCTLRIAVLAIREKWRCNLRAQCMQFFGNLLYMCGNFAYVILHCTLSYTCHRELIQYIITNCTFNYVGMYWCTIVIKISKYYIHQLTDPFFESVVLCFDLSNILFVLRFIDF